METGVGTRNTECIEIGVRKNEAYKSWTQLQINGCIRELTRLKLHKTKLIPLT